jgi:aspartate kinase
MRGEKKPRLVMKFGGTSVADTTRLEGLVVRVRRELEAGYDVAVVVSAMAGETDRLVGLAEGAVRVMDGREYDTLLSTGEQVTASLLAMMLSDRGIPARSWLGWQIPLDTDGRHGRACIEKIGTEGIERRFSEEGMVAVCAGFQGVSDRGRVTTLGRGGSDITAVALSVALGAGRCDIYTDVKGFYTADPRIVPKARVIGEIGYEESLELASSGAKVLQVRSVEMAMRYGVKVRVLSSFEECGGTSLVGEGEGGARMEKQVVTGLAMSTKECRVTLAGVKDVPGVASEVFRPLADRMIDVDMIVQSVSKQDGKTNMTFSVQSEDVDEVEKMLIRDREKFPYEELSIDKGVVKISLVGLGMRSHAGVAQRMFEVLAEKGINILVISTSEIKVSVLIGEDYGELAMRSLHTAFGLDEGE